MYMYIYIYIYIYTYTHSAARGRRIEDPGSGDSGTPLGPGGDAPHAFVATQDIALTPRERQMMFLPMFFSP